MLKNIHLITLQVIKTIPSSITFLDIQIWLHSQPSELRVSILTDEIMFNVWSKYSPQPSLLTKILTGAKGKYFVTRGLALRGSFSNNRIIKMDSLVKNCWNTHSAMFTNHTNNMAADCSLLGMMIIINTIQSEWPQALFCNFAKIWSRFMNIVSWIFGLNIQCYLMTWNLEYKQFFDKCLIAHAE